MFRNSKHHFTAYQSPFEGRQFFARPERKTEGCSLLVFIVRPTTNIHLFCVLDERKTARLCEGGFLDSPFITKVLITQNTFSNCAKEREAHCADPALTCAKFSHNRFVLFAFYLKSVIIKQTD